MDDLISRQAAIDALRKRMDKSAKGDIGSFYNTVIIRNIEILESLPPAQPEPQRTGRWIFDENDYLTKCSECGCHPWFGVIPTVKEATKKLPHCPMCLAKMEGE